MNYTVVQMNASQQVFHARSMIG